MASDITDEMIEAGARALAKVQGEDFAALFGPTQAGMLGAVSAVLEAALAGRTVVEPEADHNADQIVDLLNEAFGEDTRKFNDYGHSSLVQAWTLGYSAASGSVGSETPAGDEGRG